MVAQLHSAKTELRFCAGSNPARDLSEIRNDEDLYPMILKYVLQAIKGLEMESQKGDGINASMPGGNKRSYVLKQTCS